MTPFDVWWPTAAGGFVPYNVYIQSETWTEKSRQVRALVGHCETCGSVSGLSVHHKHYRTLGHEKPSDLIVLCHECHDRQHRG